MALDDATCPCGYPTERKHSSERHLTLGLRGVPSSRGILAFAKDQWFDEYAFNTYQLFLVQIRLSGQQFALYDFMSLNF